MNNLKTILIIIQKLFFSSMTFIQQFFPQCSLHAKYSLTCITSHLFNAHWFLFHCAPHWTIGSCVDVIASWTLSIYSLCWLSTVGTSGHEQQQQQKQKNKNREWNKISKNRNKNKSKRKTKTACHLEAQIGRSSLVLGQVNIIDLSAATTTRCRLDGTVADSPLLLLPLLLLLLLWRGRHCVGCGRRRTA